jgi:hypothetical protein
MQLVDQYLPVFRDFILECKGNGMLDGWRNIEKVEVFETGEVV